MRGVQIDECATLGQIAAELNLSPTRVQNWSVRYADFPPPVATFGKARVYRRSEVIAWATTRGGDVE